MKSIQSKMILLILMGIMVTATIIGGVGIFSFGRTIDNEAVRLMNLMCSEKAQELNSVLGRIEQSVEILSVYAIDNLESRDRLSNDSEYLVEYVEKLEELGLTIANETEGAVAVYMRFDPEINPTASRVGFFKVEDEQTGRFEDCEPTDLTQYSPDDIGHVGWYHIPVREGKPVWMQPYYNENIWVYMISYVIPIYKNDELVGIVGMDIDFSYITEKSDSIKIYETGCAFLTDEDLKIVHSRNHQQGTSINGSGESFVAVEKDVITGMDTFYDYTVDGVEWKAAFQTLENGMCLAVTAPVSEINSIKYRLVVQTIIAAVLIIMVFSFIALKIAKTIVKPLKELNIAAQKIADGNLEVSLSCNSQDEVGTLSKSLREMANQLKMRMDFINGLAYMDMLTGIQNNTAYSREISMIRDDIQNGKSDFAVFVVDVNGLKYINDTYGHEYGNKLITKTAVVIAEVFGHKNVYRIGGDEFAVIMRGGNSEECRELEQKFEERLKERDGEIRILAAIGSSVYDKNIDSDYESVFKRADGEMYKRKQKMKAQGENSTVEIKE